ncbi:hypothetical protein [Leptospira ilyithenensis]|uniref:Addiction module protein n=1 Tax=Leptospira ilyithenensis TaxID=2484901 RepID=A0A4R9LK08_9LEPT|nr:hypothetical protein [Leptospira ilyithenensis]TGN07226.1 hypothetical protein EHS11_18390 [Leptospira ilyithenensis]
MDLNDQIEALASIWDHIAESNPALPLSQEDMDLLDHRFDSEKHIDGAHWNSIKNKLFDKS